MKNPLRKEGNDGPWALVSDAPLGSGFAGVHYGEREDLRRIADLLFNRGIATRLGVVRREDLEAVMGR